MLFGYTNSILPTLYIDPFVAILLVRRRVKMTTLQEVMQLYIARSKEKGVNS